MNSGVVENPTCYKSVQSSLKERVGLGGRVPM